MKYEITPDVIRRIIEAFKGRGVASVELKREQGEIVVLRVTKEKMD